MSFTQCGRKGCENMTCTKARDVCTDMYAATVTTGYERMKLNVVANSLRLKWFDTTNGSLPAGEF